MDQEYWKNRWIAQDTPWAHETSNYHFFKNFERIKEYLPSSPNLKVLVPLCGNSEIVRFFYDQGWAVTGVEFVAEAVQELIDQSFPDLTFATEGGVSSAPRITIVCDDIFSWKTQQYDFIYDRGALVAFEPSKHVAYAAHLQDLVQPGGFIYLATYWAGEYVPDDAPYTVNPKVIATLFPQMKQCFSDLEEAPATQPRYLAAGIDSIQKQHTLLQKIS